MKHSLPFTLPTSLSLSSTLWCSVPAEHAVIAKERRSGIYHLSAYYLAKSVSELPLVIIQPSVYFVVSFWIAGLNGVGSFFGCWLVLVTSSVVAQVSRANSTHTHKHILMDTTTLYRVQKCIIIVKHFICPHVQGLGFLIGAVFMDFTRGIVAAAVIMLSSMLLGGFYVKNLPFWIQWAQYTSFVTYAFDSMLSFEFTPDNQFR